MIKDIKELIYQKQYEAMKSVNKGLIQLYWEIGEEICHQQKIQGWGKSVIEVLAKELQKEFPGVKGYSARNLWLMRTFYIEYTEKTILQPLVAKLQEIDKQDVIILQTPSAELENPILPTPSGELREIDNKPVTNLAPTVREIQNPISPPMVGELENAIPPPLVAELQQTDNQSVINLATPSREMK